MGLCQLTMAAVPCWGWDHIGHQVPSPGNLVAPGPNPLLQLGESRSEPSQGFSLVLCHSLYASSLLQVYRCCLSLGHISLGAKPSPFTTFCFYNSFDFQHCRNFSNFPENFVVARRGLNQGVLSRPPSPWLFPSHPSLVQLERNVFPQSHTFFLHSGPLKGVSTYLLVSQGWFHIRGGIGQQYQPSVSD